MLFFVVSSLDGSGYSVPFLLVGTVFFLKWRWPIGIHAAQEHGRDQDDSCQGPSRKAIAGGSWRNPSDVALWSTNINAVASVCYLISYIWLLSGYDGTVHHSPAMLLARSWASLSTHHGRNQAQSTVIMNAEYPIILDNYPRLIKHYKH